MTVKGLCAAVVETLGLFYLREPTNVYIERILKQADRRGTPVLLGSIEFCKSEWQNCPTAWHGQYKGKEKKTTVKLEAIADRPLWNFHGFFGMPGCLNEINVIKASTLLNKIAQGGFPPPCEFHNAGIRRYKSYGLCT